MKTERRQIPLGFTRETVEEGQHICYLYNDDFERRRVMAKYLESGLLEGEKVLYMVDDMTPHEMYGVLDDLDVDVRSKKNHFIISEAAPAYCPTGVFGADEMLDVIRDFYMNAMADGHTGARATGEMSWCLVEGRAAPEELMAYEAKLNHLLMGHPCTACCQYDTRRFDGETLMDVLSVHPVMIVRGQLVKNPFYVAPEIFLQEYRQRMNRQ